MAFLAVAVVVGAGLYLIGLGISCFIRPRSAAKFLLGHASSGFLHYLELAVRMLVGICLVQSAPGIFYPGFFSVSGWVLIATTIVLLMVPWRWHQGFARQAVPHALRHIKLLGIASIAIGILLTATVLTGSIT